VPSYTVSVAPITVAQIEAALLWWGRNRPASRDADHRTLMQLAVGSATATMAAEAAPSGSSVQPARRPLLIFVQA